MASRSAHRPPAGRILTRREALTLLGAAGAATLAGCPMGVDGTGDNGGAIVGGCVVTPSATEGPYFVDELLNRSDLRADPATGSVQAGTPLRLKLNVSQIAAGARSALAGATVDLWHCNAQGAYSDVAANGTIGQKWLRGYQLSDASGNVEFTTIYPGWYSGRAVHIHFKVRTATAEFTSQFYFDAALTAAVFARSPYASRGLPNTSNARDGIFNDQTLLTLSPEGDGYVSTFNIAFQTA